MKIAAIIPKIGGCFNQRYRVAIAFVRQHRPYLLKYMAKQEVRGRTLPAARGVQLSDDAVHSGLIPA